MSPKTVLHHLVDELSDADCQQVITLIQRWKQMAPTMAVLANHPAFRIPEKGLVHFPTVDPVQGNSTDASTQLIEDRR